MPGRSSMAQAVVAALAASAGIAVAPSRPAPTSPGLRPPRRSDLGLDLQRLAAAEAKRARRAARRLAAARGAA